MPAKNRLFNTHFWKDVYTGELDPTEKLLFIYLFTNPLANLLGVYEIRLREIALDTGIDSDMILKILKRFESDEKVFYKKGWMCIPNTLKHQKLNPNMVKSVENSISSIPTWAYAILLKALKGFERVEHLNSILIQLESNLNLIHHQPEKRKSFDDADETLSFFEKWTKRKASKKDRETLADLQSSGKSANLIKIGILISVERSKSPINSLAYCVGAIEESADKMPDSKTHESYLFYLTNKLNAEKI